MIETKFRAWDGEGNMVYLTLEDIFEKNIHGLCCYFPYATIMQYIGIKDRNGREVYIGDIIRLNNKTYDPENDLLYEGIAVIEATEDLGYRIKPIKPIPPDWGFDSTSMWHVGEGDTTEVIGNKYENPELMKCLT